LNLREVIARALDDDERRAGEIVRQLLQVAEDLDRKPGQG